MTTMRLRALLMTLPLAAAVAVVTPASPAHAATQLLVCPTNSGTATFDPGLGLVAATQDIGGSAKIGNQVPAGLPCSSPTGVPFVGGFATINGTGELACVATPTGGLSGTASGTVRVTWYDHDEHVAGHSTITWQLLATGGLVPTITATVTSGDLNGATVVAQPTLSGFNGNCVTEPVTNLSFLSSLEFLQP